MTAQATPRRANAGQQRFKDTGARSRLSIEAARNHGVAKAFGFVCRRVYKFLPHSHSGGPMTTQQKWELFTTSVSFLGGVVLSWDAVTLVSSFQEKSGIARLAAAIRLKTRRAILKTPEGQPLQTNDQIEITFAHRSAKRNLAGFFIMTAGFLMDALIKIYYS
jgi:hypothetical protein